MTDEAADPEVVALLRGAAGGLRPAGGTAARALAGGRRRVRRRRGAALGSTASLAACAVAVAALATTGGSAAILRPLPPAAPSAQPSSAQPPTATPPTATPPTATPPTATPPTATTPTGAPTAPASSAADPSPAALPTALPAGAPPVVPVLDLAADGQAVVYTGPGWSLSVEVGDFRVTNGAYVGAPMAFSIESPKGHSHGGTFAFPLDDGRAQPAFTDAGVDRFSTAGVPYVIVDGSVPRGTVGVALTEADGSTTWAHVVDPGSHASELVFAAQATTEPMQLQAVDAAGHVTARKDLRPTLLPQPADDPGQRAATGVVTLTLRPQRAGESDPSLCLTETATGKQSCFSTFDSGHDPQELMLALSDGRYAVAGTALPGDTLVTLRIVADGAEHPLRLGDLPLSPLAFVWVGDAPVTPSVTRTIPVAPGQPTPSPSTVTFAGQRARLVFGNSTGQPGG